MGYRHDYGNPHMSVNMFHLTTHPLEIHYWMEYLQYHLPFDGTLAHPVVRASSKSEGWLLQFQAILAILMETIMIIQWNWKCRILGQTHNPYHLIGELIPQSLSDSHPYILLLHVASKAIT